MPGSHVERTGALSVFHHLFLHAGRGIYPVCDFFTDRHLLHGNPPCSSGLRSIRRYWAHVCHGDGPNSSRRYSKLTGETWLPDLYSLRTLQFEVKRSVLPAVYELSLIRTQTI